jgi:hypothetical protein
VLPEGAERVAISLDDPIEGPFVVVTREGRFVTCLGAGMLVSDLPIVTRERLDAAAARVERMREELGRVRALRESGAEGQAGLAFTRMQQQGPRFAREDAETLLRVQPLIEVHCLGLIKDLNDAVGVAAEQLACVRLEPDRLSRARKDHLLAFGDAVWSIAHLLVLVRSTSMRSKLERAEEETGEARSSMMALAALTFEWGTFTHVTRALWFLASGGKRALASVKALSGELFHDRLFRELALTALALGSEKLRAEAYKALSARVPPAAGAEGDARERAAAHFAAHASGVIDGTHWSEEMYLRLSRRRAAQLSARTTEGVCQEELDAVPEHVARIAYVTAQVSIHRTEVMPGLMVAMHGLPWLVRASPAELFLPAEWARRLLRPRGVGDVLTWFLPYLERRLPVPTREPRRVEAAPGRNDPCPCGSGKKHKRCCGGPGNVAGRGPSP